MSIIGTAAVTYGPGKMEIQEREFDTPPGTVLARVESAGICGSDIAIYRGTYAARLDLPRVLGHEWSGTVVAVGEDVSGFRIGDPIVSEEIYWCGSCAACRSGQFDFCVSADELGFTVDGAHATHVLLPARACHVLSSEIPFSVGALIEPLSVAYNAVYLAGNGVEPGQRVIVSGMGPIGLGAALWVQASGAQAIGLETRPFRQDLAGKLGIAIAESIDDIEPGADMIVEASGDHSVLHTLMPKLSVGARVITVGHTVEPVNIHLEPITNRGLTVKGSYGQIGKGTYPKVIRALAQGLVDPSAMITETVPLSAAVETFDMVISSSDYGKVQFAP
jgi:threonine dehydrogenase-like Zn-dependent dehydrogenase